jgi:hypothetical protein
MGPLCRDCRSIAFFGIDGVADEGSCFSDKTSHLLSAKLERCRLHTMLLCYCRSNLTNH